MLTESSDVATDSRGRVPRHTCIDPASEPQSCLAAEGPGEEPPEGGGKRAAPSRIGERRAAEGAAAAVWPPVEPGQVKQRVSAFCGRGSQPTQRVMTSFFRAKDQGAGL
jgi:hypothetical protein